jgi:DNA-binding NtrC family response regulator
VNPPKFLIVEDDKPACKILGDIISDNYGNGTVDLAFSSEEGIRKITDAKPPFDIVITDLKLPVSPSSVSGSEDEGIKVIDKAKEISKHTEIIVITAYHQLATASKIISRGARDYLDKPIDPPRLLSIIQNILAIQRANLEIERLQRRTKFPEIIGTSRVVDEILTQIEHIAPKDVTVCITGESGTGKELVAKALHKHSNRCREKFVAVNCATIVPTLITNELFGHEPGAFADARERKEGYFKDADGGTLFLDEFCRMPVDMQPMLLRVIEYGTFKRVGGTEDIHTDIRLIVATNKNLEEEKENGRLQPDLYYRINRIRIHMPLLRERKEDIPSLAQHLLNLYKNKHGRNDISDFLAEDVLELLSKQKWEGNVRELASVIENAVIYCSGEMVTYEFVRGILSGEKKDDSLRNWKEIITEEILIPPPDYHVLTWKEMQRISEDLGAKMKAAYRYMYLKSVIEAAKGDMKKAIGSIDFEGQVQPSGQRVVVYRELTQAEETLKSLIIR